MITVFSVLWGDKYPPDYVKRLEKMVAKNLSLDHEFVCLTDQKLEFCRTISPTEAWAGWWQKIQLFEISTGPSIYFDLDVVITGSIDYLVEFTENDISAPANWGQSGHGGIQSSVLAWHGKNRIPVERFKENPKGYIKKHWGDQEFLTEIYGGNFAKIPGVFSYKYHCRGKKLPVDARVVAFHGKPDYPEVSDQWVTQYAYT